MEQATNLDISEDSQTLLLCMQRCTVGLALVARCDKHITDRLVRIHVMFRFWDFYIGNLLPFGKYTPLNLYACRLYSMLADCTDNFPYREYLSLPEDDEELKRCGKGVCAPRSLFCNGELDCPDGSDENSDNCGITG